MGETKSFDKVQILQNGMNISSIVHKITKNNEDSVLVCDLSDIIQRHKVWMEVMPRVFPHYAVKANHHSAVIKTLASLGAGFDCASMGEIEMVLSFGVKPEKIIFANPVKYPSHIKFAKKHGVDIMTFDNEVELHKIKNLFPEARLILRLKCDSPTASICLGDKFGCDPKTAISLLIMARRLNINIIGLSFHVGTEVKDPSIYGKAILICRQIFDEAINLGFNFTVIDIGGGYEGAKAKSLEQTAAVVNFAMQKYFPDLSVNFISEPGRYYVESAFTLVCKIYAMRSVPLSETDYNKVKYIYYINDSVFKNFNCVITENKQQKPTFLRNLDNQQKYLTTIWGQTCDSTDYILKEKYLPKLNMGDYLIWENMGAYSLCINCPFNGFKYADVHNVIKKQDCEYLEGDFCFY